MRVSIATIMVLGLMLVATSAHTTQSWVYGSSGKKASGRLDESNGGWPECAPDVPQWSGYYDINSTTNKHYWYWAFGPRSGRKDAPIILWMTGGPGCASSLAIFTENGPCHMHETNATLYRNPYSWNADAFVVYIDQPAGVGYSYSDASGYDHNEKEVADDMYQFLQALMTAHSDWQSNEFFVFGESYGGHFAPATAYRVFQGNQNKDGLAINLKGLAVGNGLVNPQVQYQYYAELAYTWCQKKLGKPCVSQSTYEYMNSSIPSCVALIKSCAGGNAIDCLFARSTCNGAEIEPYAMTGLNVYDIRKQCTYPPLCYNFDAVTKFLNRADVQKALNARSTTWQSCNMDVNMQFGSDWFAQFATTMPPMMASGIRVMIYAGDVDFICNWLGNKAWTLALKWPGQSAYNKAPDMQWKLDGVAAGLVRSYSSTASPILFNFIQIYNAGHLSPMDQPKVTQAMVAHFLNNTKFV